MTFNFDPRYLPQLADGLVVTLEVTSCCIAIGIVLGILLALGRVYGGRLTSIPCSIYIHFFRGTPLLVQLFIVYFGFPNWGIRLSAFESGILALGLNTAAYQAEYFRGAIQAVKAGQMVAARSLGLTRFQAICHVVIPQALRLVIPPWSNELILMLKYSSIVFSIALYDLMGVGKRIASRHFNYFEVFIVLALMYMGLVLLITLGLRWVERRVAVPGLGSPGRGI